MQMSIRVQHDKVSARRVRDYLQAVFSEMVEKYSQRVRRVDVVIEDVNGPRGGVDKQCRCVLHLNRMPPLIIEDRDSRIGGLIRRVLERVSHNLRETIDRRQKSKAKGHHGRRRQLRAAGDAPTPIE